MSGITMHFHILYIFVTFKCNICAHALIKPDLQKQTCNNSPNQIYIGTYTTAVPFLCYIVCIFHIETLKINRKLSFSLENGILFSSKHIILPGVFSEVESRDELQASQVQPMGSKFNQYRAFSTIQSIFPKMPTNQLTVLFCVMA